MEDFDAMVAVIKDAALARQGADVGDENCGRHFLDAQKIPGARDATARCKFNP